MTAKDTMTEDRRLKTVTIEVNDHKVKMPDGPATGLEIQGGGDQAGCRHSAELHAAGPVAERIEARWSVDDDKVALTEHLAFTAIAADDNS